MLGVKLFYCSALLLLAIAFADALDRRKRFLVFPRQAPTRHQFIGGIGIPADLPYESLTVGYVLKAMFYLPYNATVFRENPFLPEYGKNPLNARNQAANSMTEKRSDLRWDIYGYIINQLDRLGYNGHECLLKAICETNSIRFDSHYNIFAELLHILFSPSTSVDKTSTGCGNFKEAGRIGRTNRSCDIYDTLLLNNIYVCIGVVGFRCSLRNDSQENKIALIDIEMSAYAKGPPNTVSVMDTIQERTNI